MFNIDHAPKIMRRVTFQVPDGPKSREEDIFVCYRVLTISEAKKFDLSTYEGTTAFLDATVERADGIIDAAGTDVPWSAKLKARLFDLPFLRLPLVQAYFEGYAEEARGN